MDHHALLPPPPDVPYRLPAPSRLSITSSEGTEMVEGKKGSRGKFRADLNSEFSQLLVTNKDSGLGAVMGVFIPCVLSIIGVVLFMRLGWAIGEAGVLGVLSMIGLGTLLSYLTAFSLCALATNGKIRGGGAYYLISRSLGPEMGGAIGMVFFAANSVGIAFYMQGFTDTIAELLDLDQQDASTYWLKLAMAGSCLLVEAVIAIVGSGLYAKCAWLLFAIQMGSITVAVASAFGRGGDAPFSWTAPDATGVNQTFTYVGPNMQTLADNLYPNYSEGNDYAVIFKTIFPALTGMFAGANMSGVLNRPELAIPRGTLTAITFSSLTYCLVIVAFGCSVPRHTLQNEYLILSRVCLPGTTESLIVTVGVIASTTSSALGSIQSASRVIQALAKDNLIPLLKPLGEECNNEPVPAILLSSVVGMGLLFIGNLNAIAPILTMFFLLTYGLTNVACFVHRVSGHPNFRPRYRFFTWHTAFLGGLYCIAVMFYLDWRYTLASILLVTVLASYIAYRPPEENVDWGDVSQSLTFHVVRKYLLRLDAEQSHVKFWRPQFMVVMQGGPCGQVPALEFIDSVKKGGLFIIGDTVTVPEQDGTRPNESLIINRDDRRQLWLRFLEEAKFKAFVEINLEQEGAPQLSVANLLASGIGGLTPNTLVMMLPEQPTDRTSMSAESKAYRRKLDVTSNSVYEQGAADGCRITCAYQDQLWSQDTSAGTVGDEAAAGAGAGGEGYRIQDDEESAAAAAAAAATADGAAAAPGSSAARSNLDESEEAEGNGADQQENQNGHSGSMSAGRNVSTADYVGMLQDAVSARKHLVLLGAMAELQKHEIAQRLGKFSPQSQEAWIRKQSPEKQQQERARRETLNPWVIGAPVVVDVWVMPWCDQADLMLSCQLAYMLSRDDFWTKHSYLRVCGVVGSFSELGADDCDSGVTLEQRRAELYNEVWRSMRIPATIEVFNAQDVVPQVWASSREEFQAAAKWSGSVNSPGRPGRWEMADQSQRALCTVLNAVVREVNANTAVSICSCPDVPVRSEPDQAAAAERFMSDLTQLTAGIGPTMLVKALPGSNVVTTDL